MLVISDKVLEGIFDDLENQICSAIRYMFIVVKRRPLKHHHNELYSKIQKAEIVRNVFRYCLMGLFLNMLKI